MITRLGRDTHEAECFVQPTGAGARCIDGFPRLWYKSCIPGDIERRVEALRPVCRQNRFGSEVLTCKPPRYRS